MEDYQMENTSRAVFGAGCFWGVEAAFRKVNGVQNVTSGYTGGNYPNPTYRLVCSGATSHVEVVQVEYNPQIVTFNDLLDTFFAIHDATQIDRQGPDKGSQYRTAIFTTSDAQSQAARARISQFNANLTFGQPVATTVEPLKQFWPAEDYHQNYISKNPSRCSM